MASYVLVFTGGGAMATTEEGRSEELARWGVWYGGLGQGIVDGGKPFGASVVVAADGTVTPGAPSGLSGYAIVSAESLEAATAMTQGCPILTNGGTIEVYETFEVM